MKPGVGDDPGHLIQEVVAGDREAFARFYDRYAPLVFTLTVRILGVRSEAEDLLQEVFLQVWSQADSYRQDRGSPEAWITTITRSRAIDRLRSIRSREKGVMSLTVASGVESGVPGGAVTAEVETSQAGRPTWQTQVREFSEAELVGLMEEGKGTWEGIGQSQSIVTRCSTLANSGSPVTMAASSFRAMATAIASA